MYKPISFLEISKSMCNKNLNKQKNNIILLILFERRVFNEIRNR